MQRSKTNWVEIIGLMPSSLILGKLLLVGLLGMMLVMGAEATRASHPPGSWRAWLGGTALFMLLMMAGLAGLAGLWAAVLLGAERVRRKSWQRGAVVACLVLGMGAAGYWLSWMGTQAHSAVAAGSWGWVFWSLLVAPPIAVGAHQIYLLLRPVAAAGAGS